MLGSMLFLVVQSGVAAVDMWTRWCMSDLACPTVFEEADELWRRLMGLAHTVRRSLRSTGREWRLRSAGSAWYLGGATSEHGALKPLAGGGR